MIWTAVWRSSGGRLLSLALLGGMTFAPAVMPGDVSAHMAPATQRTWLTLQNGRLCRLWSSTPARTTPAPTTAQSQMPHSRPLAMLTVGDGTTVHCTTKWHVSTTGNLISDAPSYVPNPTGDWPVAATPARYPRTFRRMALTTATATVQLTAKVVRRVPPPPPVAQTFVPQLRATSSPAAPAVAAPASSQGVAPGGIGLWTPPPGHPAYGLGDFAGDPYSSSYGTCTWYAWYRRQDERLASFGPATNWISGARTAGLATGSSPAAGATAVFAPGVEGAGGGGHAAHVEQVLGGGWFLISEMNFTFDGGGWGRVSYRYALAGPGVSFIY